MFSFHSSGKKKCIGCGAESELVAGFLSLCSSCIRRDFDSFAEHIQRVHARSRRRFGLPPAPPGDVKGLRCKGCINECMIGEGRTGYCGLRHNHEGVSLQSGEGGGILSWYFDPLPTNCVGGWVCAGGTGAGYPRYCYAKGGGERGYKNLAVFYIGCSFNCLFCQNYHFRYEIEDGKRVSVGELAGIVDWKTSCICFFGGDPVPQIAHSIRVAEVALNRARKEGRILRVCWETNGSMRKDLLDRIMELAVASGGCVKFDLKAWDEGLHIALCGVSNRRTLENFELAGSKWFRKRREPPVLIASTLLVPGYIDEDEVGQIAEFIASIDPDIPYSLLAFHPHFYFSDLPLTGRAQADACVKAARRAGVRRMRIGNIHLLS